MTDLVSLRATLLPVEGARSASPCAVARAGHGAQFSERRGKVRGGPRSRTHRAPSARAFARGPTTSGLHRWCGITLAEYLLVPHARANLAVVPDELSDEQVLMLPDTPRRAFRQP